MRPENQSPSDLPAELAAAHRRISELAAELRAAQPEPARTRRDFRFRTLFTSNILGINLADSRGRVFLANDCFLDMVGYERHELPLDWIQMTPAEWRDTDRSKVEELEVTGVARPWEKELRHKDGRRVPVLIAVARLAEGEHECLAVVLDLSDTKQAEAALRASEERYRTLYENIPLMYFDLDADGHVLSVNACGARELGYEPDELVGRPVLDVFHAADRAAARDQLTACLADPRSVRRCELRKIRKDGSELCVSEALWAVQRGNGELGILVACENITERKLAERRLHSYQQALRQLFTQAALGEERERRRIALGLHDDVGQTLATAQMVAVKLRRLVGDGEAAGLVDEIHGLLDRSIDATRSLTFELSSPVLRELGLEAAIEDCAQRIAAAHGLELRLSRRGGGTVPAGEDTIVLYRAVRELLHNVGKHARAQALRLTLRAPEGGGFEVIVEDDGIGFDTSEWVRSSTERGFGLFSVREQVSQLGYRFQIESSPGRGTRAALLSPEPAAAHPADDHDPADLQLGHGAVLGPGGDPVQGLWDTGRDQEPRR